ncbi:MAG: bifunctional glutamate N-acetyltransferase/amino-acid acetyltransferase ArgJ [Pirellulales bacterium]|nr:bifunctional glutamate N-acetyltransferase/amino-acid acetyltransferase ArgJ [Pirellulales bacterium]
MSISLPVGFRVAGVHAGVKHDDGKLDLALVATDRPATAVGVYTQNLVFAAPVALDRQRTPSDQIRGVVVNSGNANACTGDRGYRDAEQMAALAAAAIGATPEQLLVMSTGVIGRFLPMEKIEKGIAAAGQQLGVSDAHLVAAAQAMMTTDTRHKLATASFTARGKTFRVTGMCKGAAMIGPNMATMLAVVMTDAALAPPDAQRALQAAVSESFNAISVDGHMSTNDTVLLLASGAADAKPLLAPDDRAAFGRALAEVCRELARMIPADGEGATHLVTIDIEGAADRASAHRIAKTIAESALVKTAIAGADPNWGRIVSAAGYAGVPFDPSRVDLRLNGFLLYEAGSPVSFDAAEVSRSIREHRDTSIVLTLGEGDTRLRFWTTDLTAEYVRLNADYTT